MRIGVDIDDVLIDFYKPFVRFYNEKFKKNLKIGDLIQHDFSKVLGITSEQAHELVLEFYKTSDFYNANLIENSKQSIEELNKNHQILFITSRSEEVKEETRKRLKEIFPALDLDISHSTDYFGKNRYKSEICSEKKVDIMVEDSAKNANKIAEKGIKCFLLEQPWNIHSEKHPKVVCVKNWNEILEKLK